MTNAALIVAAGRGTRAGRGAPKQWRRLAGRRLADWTLDRFRMAPGIDLICLVLNPDDAEQWREFDGLDGLVLAIGGANRAASVRSGLQALQAHGVKKVLIHDMARPCVSGDIIAEVLTALDSHPGAAPGLPVTDALWVGANARVTGTQQRSALYTAQTPQGFQFEQILGAHLAHTGAAADDVEVARTAGIDVTIVPGHPDNLKITQPEDFDRASRILRQDHMHTRIGNGFDAHRFQEGDHIILCGISIPHSLGLQGHSDADVGMHALTDAIYGALARGDIGQHFPPSDPQWKGADSQIFLRHAVALAAEMGYRLGNADCTLICEFPKIGPHADRMRTRLAEIMGLDIDQVSVKATTSEQLGFTGRGEGIAALTSVTLLRV
ncbi:MAG: bifunctional 2-C-methyl-D-erythritol 4-phosphate cytidylyltransferase/2-C-methyl-D-erythritol 2,4-cyclodiphosphate synthase [Rhodobacteraceae bacterium]|nr:bifunctional 2-C-methyl-D-erythritol 4-phosphate cytidylyltransferase/2-C-methyl-D-erythritol 2,4-cyclodiphosphate synthase [Paracoccaceae bacterium]